jgi:hypothetical protein
MLHPDRVKAPDRGRDLFGTGPRLEAIAGDIRNTRSGSMPSLVRMVL